MITALDVFRAAYATSKLNEPGRIADESGELLSILNTDLRGYFADGARTNRRFFLKKFATPFVAGTPSGSWPRPAGAEMVVRLEAGDAMGNTLVPGTEIADIPFDQRHIEPGKPAVYNLGQHWYAAGRGGDPVSGLLTVFASASPTPLVGIADAIDPLWPATFVPLLKWGIAIYLAQKDGGRDNEVTAFTAQQAKEYGRYLAYLEHETTTEVRSYGHAKQFTSPSVTPRK